MILLQRDFSNLQTFCAGTFHMYSLVRAPGIDFIQHAAQTGTRRQEGILVDYTCLNSEKQYNKIPSEAHSSSCRRGG